MNQLDKGLEWARTNKDAFIDAVRVYLGVGLIVKGAYFLAEQDYFMGLIDQSGMIPASKAMAWAIVGIHVVGGLMLTLGLLTRIAAAAQVPILFGAAVFVALPQAGSVEGRQQLEFTALACFLAVLLMVFGTGRFSLDKPAKAPCADGFMDLVRIYLGIGLIAKGVFFLGEREYLSSLIDQAGGWSFIPIAAAHYVIPAHIAGGLLLALGLLTRLAALAQVPILLGAVYYLHLPQMVTLQGRQDFEFTALVLFLVALHAVFGAGKYSLDHVLARRADEVPSGAPAHQGAKA
jgi:putative oxidoreductase